MLNSIRDLLMPLTTIFTTSQGFLGNINTFMVCQSNLSRSNLKQKVTNGLDHNYLSKRPRRFVVLMRIDRILDIFKSLLMNSYVYWIVIMFYERLTQKIVSTPQRQLYTHRERVIKNIQINSTFGLMLSQDILEYGKNISVY